MGASVLNPFCIRDLEEHLKFHLVEKDSICPLGQEKDLVDMAFGKEEIALNIQTFTILDGQIRIKNC